MCNLTSFELSQDFPVGTQLLVSSNRNLCNRILHPGASVETTFFVAPAAIRTSTDDYPERQTGLSALPGSTAAPENFNVLDEVFAVLVDESWRVLCPTDRAPRPVEKERSAAPAQTSRARTSDVIHLSPKDPQWALGLNVLQAVRPDERALVVSQVVSIFRRLWADSWGPQVADAFHLALAG